MPFRSPIYIFVEFFPLYINRETTTKTSLRMSKSNWGQCQKDSLDTSQVDFRDCSFMCMKWSKRQVYIMSRCFLPISNCQKINDLCFFFFLILYYYFFFFFFFFPSLTPCFATLLFDTLLTDPFFLLACIPGFLLSLEVYALFFFTCNLQYFTYMRDVSSYIPTPLVLQNYFTKSAFTNYIITISIINNFFFVLLPLFGRMGHEKVETQKAAGAE